jgi:hypothetical protein
MACRPGYYDLQALFLVREAQTPRSGPRHGSTGGIAFMNIKLCGINLHGDFFSILAPDLATARVLGMSRVEEGAWRAWDAFDVRRDAPAGRRLLESSPYVSATKRTAKER